MSTTAEAVKERPILFSGEMVRAILAGTKTQTRRIVKPAPTDWHPLMDVDDRGFVWTVSLVQKFKPGKTAAAYRSPYGVVGDRLWVRETWAIRDCGRGVPLDTETWVNGWPKDRLRYIATDNAPYKSPKGKPYWWNSRPSIHMPRWASRITLEVVSVRVERLQNISVNDACEEGAPIYDDCPNQTHAVLTWYADLWESIHGEGSWDANPWVWCVSFKRL